MSKNSSLSFSSFFSFIFYDASFILYYVSCTVVFTFYRFSLAPLFFSLPLFRVSSSLIFVAFLLSLFLLNLFLLNSYGAVLYQCGAVLFHLDGVRSCFYPVLNGVFSFQFFSFLVFILYISPFSFLSFFFFFHQGICFIIS